MDNRTWVVEGVIIKCTPVTQPTTPEPIAPETPAPLTITAQTLPSIDLKAGDIVTTSGFYTENDGGSQQYVISTDISTFSIVLDNGLYANPVFENNTINMLSIGAVNDGITDNSELINKAFNSGTRNIYFPAGIYLCDYRLEITNGKNINIYGEENNSIIATDSDYIGDTTTNENFFILWGCENISFNNITFKATEKWTVSYQRQLSVYYSNGISINNCSFIVPASVKEVGPNTDREYTNLALYTGWKNITIKNCYFEQLGAVERGCNIIITDIWNAGCENLTIHDNIFYHNAHDEMFSLFGGTDESSYIKNVSIKNNEFNALYSNEVSDKTMCFTFGYNDSKNVSDVIFNNNTINATTPYSLMTFGNIENCELSNNDITITNNSYYNNGIGFLGTPGVTVKNNNITINGTDNDGMATLASGDFLFIENTVTINTSMRYVFTEGNIINNTIILNDYVQSVAQAPKLMEGNNVEINGKADNFISYIQVTLKCDSAVNNNVFLYNYNDKSDSVSFLTGNAVYVNIGTKLNNKTILFSNNTIEAPNVNTFRKNLLAYCVTDSTAQTFIFKNNTSNVYKDYVYLCQGQQCNIVTS